MASLEMPASSLSGYGNEGMPLELKKRHQPDLLRLRQTYNRWSWYCMAANPSARMPAITSRPL